MFSNKGLQRLGDVFQRVTVEAFNRTGQTLEKGLAAMMDFAGTQTETDSITLGDSGNAYANLTPVTQAGIDAGYPVVICLEDSLADNQKGVFLLFGHDQVAILDDDESTTDVNQGNGLAFAVGESVYALQAQAVTSHRVFGIAHEAAEASGGGISTPDGSPVDAELKFCLWWGGVPGLGMTKDA